MSSVITRPWIGWTGRLFVPPPIASNRSTCSRDTVRTSRTTCHATPPAHGGVVFEPVVAEARRVRRHVPGGFDVHAILDRLAGRRGGVEDRLHEGAWLAEREQQPHRRQAAFSVGVDEVQLGRELLAVDRVLRGCVYVHGLEAVGAAAAHQLVALGVIDVDEHTIVARDVGGGDVREHERFRCALDVAGDVDRRLLPPAAVRVGLGQRRPAFGPAGPRVPPLDRARSRLAVVRVPLIVVTAQ